MNDLLAISSFLACLFVCFLAGLRHERRKHKDAMLEAQSRAFHDGRLEGIRECRPVAYVAAKSAITKAENKETR